MVTSFPPESPEHIAQSALTAAQGDHAAAMQKARTAIRVLARWQLLKIIDEDSVDQAPRSQSRLVK